jgi:hypothetical protein
VTPSANWVLTVDFGTTNTVASIGDAEGVHTLTIDGRTVMPSAVLLTEGSLGFGGGWVVGESAINMAYTRMECFVATPKHHIADGSLLLGDSSVPVVEAIAAVLRFVVDEAVRQRGARSPDMYVVTHPAGWPDSRITVLKEAAKTAVEHRRDWPEPVAMPEPHAAAQGALRIEGVGEEARIVVLDLGGGTVDVAIVDRAGQDLSVVGRPIGMEGAAGEDFDFRLAEWMTEEAGVRGLYRRLADSDDPTERERAVRIRRLARAIKEELSRRPVVPAQLPRSPPDLDSDTRVQVARPQFEQLVRGGPGHLPGLVEAVELVNEVQKVAPEGPPFTGVYLVGGSSRIPLLGELIQAQTGSDPLVGGDPSTAVADGAADYAYRQIRRSPGPPPPPPPPPPPGGTPPPPPKIPLRTVLGALVALMLMIGGVLILNWHGRDQPDSQTDSSSGSTQSATSSRSPDAGPSDGSALLGTCSSPTEGDCRSAIIAASRAAWPDMPVGGCDVHGALYGSDRYSAECRTGDMSYLVFWRDSGSVASMLAGQMLMPTLRDFVLPGGSKALGDQAFGTRRTPSGERFTCAWEYSRFPVTMVIDGPNNDATLSRCGTATFLDETALRSALRPT